MSGGAESDEAPGGPRAWDPDPSKVRLIMELRRRGVTHGPTLAAIERIPRAPFLPEELAEYADADHAMPIACGQTTPPVHLIAVMTQALELRPEHKALEVGAGAGYQTALLAALARTVISLERWAPLLEAARTRLSALGIDNVDLRLADGAEGAPLEAPFDRILVTAAVPVRPDVLIEQLDDDGVLVAPVGGPEGQKLMRYRRTADGVTAETLQAVRFAPLAAGVGSVL